MIRYKVKARLAQNLGTDDFQLEEFQEVFENIDNPIQARKEAFRYYSNIIDIVGEEEDDYDAIQKHISEKADIGYIEIGNFKVPSPMSKDNLGIGIYILIDEDFEGLLYGQENMIIGYFESFDYLSVAYHLESEYLLYKKQGWNTDNWIIDLKYFDYEYDEYDEGEKMKSEKGDIETPTLYTPFDFWAFHNPSMVEGNDEEEDEIEEPSLLERIIEKGETRTLEFKSTLRYCIKNKKPLDYIEHSILKTIAAFANCDGGTLLVGVDDDGEVLGLENDFGVYKDNPRDKFLKHFANMIGSGFTEPIDALLKYQYEQSGDKMIFLIVVQKSNKPRFLKAKGNKEAEKEFYIRRSATSQRLDIEDAVKYSIDKWYARD